MFKRTLFGMALAASVAVAQPPMPRPMHVALPAPQQLPPPGPMVRAELTVVRLHPETMRALELWKDADTNNAHCFLTSCQTRKVLEMIKADDRCEVVSAPQMVMLDSQHGQVNIASDEHSGMDFSVTPRVSLDHRFIQVAFAAEIREHTPANAARKCCSSDTDCAVQQATILMRRMSSVVCVPTGNSVFMEIGRPNSTTRCEVSLGGFFQAEVCATKERHLCVLVTPTEMVSTPACAQPMSAIEVQGPGSCQIVMPAPMAYPHPVPAAQVVMGRVLDFVPAQEQEMRQRQRDPHLDKLMDKYEQACADGDMDKARKLARRCLDIDPTCFMRDQ